MSRASFIRRAALAGALALTFTGATAGIEVAQAMPAAPVLAGPGDAGVLTTVQYMHPRHRRNRYNRAGLYNCGRYALHTHLERRACGSIGPSRDLRRR